MKTIGAVKVDMVMADAVTTNAVTLASARVIVIGVTNARRIPDAPHGSPDCRFSAVPVAPMVMMRTTAQLSLSTKGLVTLPRGIQRRRGN